MKFTKEIDLKLSKFFDSYRKKNDFLQYLAKKHQGETEIILLICCYIDQLGACLFPKAGSNKSSFELMLLNHSGEMAEFSRISVAELATNILWSAENIDILIRKPGRLQFFQEDRKSLIKLICDSDIAITRKKGQKLLLKIFNALKKRYRIHPHQTKSKLSYGDGEEVIDTILNYGKLEKVGARIKTENLKSLVRDYRYNSILYHEYRCKAVHEAAGLVISKRKFWRLKRPYFGKWTYSNLSQAVFKIEFPAAFLINCFETCLECAEKAIYGKGLLPGEIWAAICDIEEDEFLDSDEMEFRVVKFKID